ncbi:copper amine oxidase N-terminal domain-containing protein [Meiothermus sp. QL-1]|uniref:stalk domain-containing protein n=1 Tax=Meiothermus sp. QL-1 TaxID=2058095 RepID=UPI000E0C4EBA|nr:stalk domain-containing protein [Meiothermus sp. QL-1]RDI95139.1 copper amine oxidase N-terminal domain-containing protein [Meiothermus sp. QL-1]
MGILRLGLAFLLGFGWALAQPIATRQLLLDLGSGAAFLNGAPLVLLPPPRVVGGRALLPLRETARALGVELESLQNGAAGVRLGRLELYPGSNTARLEGRELALGEVGQVIEGVFFITARGLEAALGATLVYDPAQRALLLSYTPPASFREPNRPVARFLTDKTVYRIGEPVRVVNYSYDPDGQPLAFNFTGLEEAYFTPGERVITLVATNRAGLSSEPFTRRIQVVPEVLYTPLAYALRFYAPGRTFPDPGVLAYPLLEAVRQDEPLTLLLSNSPEQVPTSGLLYADTVSGPIRLLAHHVNATGRLARLVVLASNAGAAPLGLGVERLGETAATRVVAVLGQGSLLDFWQAQPGEEMRLMPGQTLVLYRSAPLAPGQGVHLLADLRVTGPATLSVLMLEEGLWDQAMEVLPLLPSLEPDGTHVRGTFPSALRHLQVDLGTTPSRLVLGDGVQDPPLSGTDALTGQTVRLRGNYGATYRIEVQNARGSVVAFSPRGGPYAGAIRINGLLWPLPANGVLLQPDQPLLLHRETQDRLSLEFIPAPGSFLPVSLLFYRLEGG